MRIYKSNWTYYCVLQELSSLQIIYVTQSRIKIIQ